MADTSLFVRTPDNTTNENVELKQSKFEYRVFLAGTIDNGSSDDWQKKVIGFIEPKASPIAIYNPRKDSWDPNAGHDGVMKQIDWEQRALASADHIIMCIMPGSKSPICLLELGLFAKSEKITVFCEKSFWRYDNVLDTCNRYNIELINSTNPKLIARKIMAKNTDWCLLTHPYN